MKVESYYRSVEAKSIVYQVTEVSDSTVTLKRVSGGGFLDRRLVEVTKARFNKAFTPCM